MCPITVKTGFMKFPHRSCDGSQCSHRHPLVPQNCYHGIDYLALTLFRGLDLDPWFPLGKGVWYQNVFNLSCLSRLFAVELSKIRGRCTCVFFFGAHVCDYISAGAWSQKMQANVGSRPHRGIRSFRFALKSCCCRDRMFTLEVGLPWSW